MTILDTAILNLMKELENKEISWEEYKLKLKKILDSKNNNLADEEIKKEENISSNIIYEDNVNFEDNVNYEDKVNFEDKVNVETAINNQPKIKNILLHDEEVIEKENEIIKEETVELGIIGQKPENKTPTIQIKNLNKKYKHKHILKNVSFNVYPGEIHLLTGPCSSGKTTIIKSIVCAFPKDQIKGEILINNRRNYELSANKKIGFVPETMNYSKKIKLKDYIANFALFTTSIEKLDNRINKIIGKFTLEKNKNEKMYSLSSGEIKKAFLAQALIDKPNILILDQPEIYLDYNDQQKIYEYLTELKNKGKTILIVSNNLHEMNKYATYCTILNEGKVVFDGLLNKDISSLKDIYKKHIYKEDLHLDQTKTNLLLDKIHS